MPPHLPPTTLRTQLRRATGDLHGALDALLGRLDLSTLRDLGRLLDVHARVLPGVERALEGQGVWDDDLDWASRARAGSLARDREVLGLPPPPSPSAEPTFPTPAARMGAIYVLEGSRAGGAMLARSLAPSAPRAFLTHGIDAHLWPTFARRLEAHPPNPASEGAAVAVFERYLEAAQEVCR